LFFEYPVKNVATTQLDDGVERRCGN